ncbi:helix-turn-helix domain-containing protein, partial [Arsenophonus sp.]|uniref:helix-turn-helix domain-containing protein n=1 Tax=Arsenophonus sp. TaxID=1872640 RepID=UPI00387A36E8
MSNTHLNGMNINLTQEQKLKLRNLHRKSRDRLVCDRIRCVLLCTDGWTPEMIADSQLIHETTVRRHLNDWLNGEKLAPENGGSD